MGNQRTQQTRKGPGYTNTVDYGYDPLGQVLSAVGKEVDGSTRLHEKFGYKYDAAGNLGTRTNNALIQNFAVNEVNQLTNVTRTGGSTLTVSGNTSSKATNVAVNGQTTSLYADLLFAKDGFTLTNGTNTFTAIAESPASIFDTNTIAVNLPATNTFKFDANGNMTFDGQKAFEYDDENQLVRVTETNVFKSEFTYDGLGRMRVKKEYTWSGSWALTSETRYIYDGMLVIQERGANSAPLVSYTRGKDLSGGMQGAGGIGGLLARTDHTTASVLLKTAFYHADGNGNITALLSTNGLVLAWYQYSPFGTMLAQGGPLADANSFRFSSKMWHDRSGLYYYGYRFYSPNLQRWLNADPIGEAGGINLYGFVGNRVINALDSWGYKGKGDGEIKPVTIAIYDGDDSTDQTPVRWCGMKKFSPANGKRFANFGKTFDLSLNYNDLAYATDSNGYETRLQSLVDYLKQLKDEGVVVGRVVFVDHGYDGYQEIGDEHIPKDDQEFLKALGEALPPDAVISFWGCNVANGQTGRDYLQAIANGTGLTVDGQTGPAYYLRIKSAPVRGGDVITVPPED